MPLSHTISYRDVAAALGNCTFLPASWDKRFARNMARVATQDLRFTERQENHLLRLAHKYRRQISARVLEGALDLAESAADRRAAAGKGALADFSAAARQRRKHKKAAQPTQRLPRDTEAEDQGWLTGP